MTQQFSFTIELKTTDDIDQTKAQNTIAQFVSRLSENEKVLSSTLDMERMDDTTLTEDDCERLLRTIEQVDSEDIAVAEEIAKSLSSNND